MTAPDPYQLFFGGLSKLGPSSEEITRDTARALPDSSLQTIVDAGCGTGAQTLVLASELQQVIHAIDNHQSFLDELQQRAEKEGVSQFVETHCMDLAEIPNQFSSIDLLWSEGAAYSIGFENAIQTWAASLAENGMLVVSELCWLKPAVPPTVKEYFDEGYPQMKNVADNQRMIEAAGFRILRQTTLPENSWVDGYYDELEARANSLIHHDDEVIREFAEGTLKEIEIYRESLGSYGYVLFTLSKSN